jgi:hypothetical protein
VKAWFISSRAFNSLLSLGSEAGIVPQGRTILGYKRYKGLEGFLNKILTFSQNPLTIWHKKRGRFVKKRRTRPFSLTKSRKKVTFWASKRDEMVAFWHKNVPGHLLFLQLPPQRLRRGGVFLTLGKYVLFS